MFVCGCDYPSSLQTYKQIVADLKGGKIWATSEGEIILPTNLRNATIDDRAYVTQLPQGNYFVLFRTWQGYDANLRGYLFSNGPLLAPGSTLTVRTAYTRLGVNAGYQMGDAAIIVIRAIEPGWYFVSRDLDSKNG